MIRSLRNWDLESGWGPHVGDTGRSQTGKAMPSRGEAKVAIPNTIPNIEIRIQGKTGEVKGNGFLGSAMKTGSFTVG